jgi:hypothetical protein
MKDIKNTHLLIIAVILILLIGSIAAGTIVLSELYKQIAPKSCDDFKAVENGYIWLPKSVSDIFKGAQVNLHFKMVNGNEISVNGIVEESKISRLECGRSSNYDFEIWMSDRDALELTVSDKPVTTFVTLWRKGNIRINANGIENEQKLAYADQLVAKDNEPVPDSIQKLFAKYVNIR